jgi:hypothetical protein
MVREGEYEEGVAWVLLRRKKRRAGTAAVGQK